MIQPSPPGLHRCAARRGYAPVQTTYKPSVVFGNEPRIMGWSSRGVWQLGYSHDSPYLLHFSPFKT